VEVKEFWIVGATVRNYRELKWWPVWEIYKWQKRVIVECEEERSDEVIQSDVVW